MACWLTFTVVFPRVEVEWERVKIQAVRPARPHWMDLKDSRFGLPNAKRRRWAGLQIFCVMISGSRSPPILSFKRTVAAEQFGRNPLLSDNSLKVLAAAIQSPGGFYDSPDFGAALFRWACDF